MSIGNINRSTKVGQIHIKCGMRLDIDFLELVSITFAYKSMNIKINAPTLEEKKCTFSVYFDYYICRLSIIAR